MAKIALRTNRKFRKLCALLRLDSPAHALGHLEEFWSVSHEQGTPLVGDYDDIEHSAKWPTASPEKYPRGAFADALRICGFLVEVAPGKLYAIKDWLEHAPQWVKQRVSRAAQADQTVCAESFYLGIEKWLARATEAGLSIDDAWDDVEAPPPASAPEPPENVETANGDRNRGAVAETVTARSPKPGRSGRNGDLSSQAKGSEAKRSAATPPHNPLSPLLPASPPVDAAAVALWRDARDLLRLELANRDPDGFDKFIAPLRAIDFGGAIPSGSMLRVWVPNARCASIVTESYGEAVTLALELAAGRPVGFSALTGTEAPL